MSPRPHPLYKVLRLAIGDYDQGEENIERMLVQEWILCTGLYCTVVNPTSQRISSARASCSRDCIAGARMRLMQATLRCGVAQPYFPSVWSSAIHSVFNFTLLYGLISLPAAFTLPLNIREYSSELLLYFTHSHVI